MQSAQSRGAVDSMVLTIGGLVTFIVVVIIFFSWLGSYLAARAVGSLSGDTYRPLVRYYNGTTWCYDNDSGFCAQLEGTAFVREAVVGDVIAGAPATHSPTLYGCFNTTTQQYTVTLNSRRDCYRQLLVPLPLGKFVLQSSDATAPLYYCSDPAHGGTYLTTVQDECVTRDYTTPHQIGFVRRNTTTGAITAPAQ